MDYKRTTRIKSLVRLQTRDPIRQLGVTLDTGLHLQEHIKERLKLGQQAAGALKALCNSKGGVTHEKVLLQHDPPHLNLRQ